MGAIGEAPSESSTVITRAGVPEAAVRAVERGQREVLEARIETAPMTPEVSLTGRVAVVVSGGDRHRLDGARRVRGRPAT